ncbi:redoxin domain-containing protein [Marinithermus hydrothermalis]|uniref:Alkyl hydroperoxide reductase/ Thiol specific antioxidant/ Mal allergen n=1 Tax=Marinithermus hydrothermalis (strain DSM 14884 / JCM 11576 / T1) TaxID=869210 RepID=F2NMP2_MARHT|nr:redoxin domain-containing protein [Marinithermus hydrothermalis]AEB12426.1 alkyl hydroperoxide reductase/ Thiol specific antioxidant/ Mal allergen [Marinithermus hydrothermalis DSM 14884]
MSLKAGDPLPNATVLSANLEPVNLRTYAAGKPRVILFFPAVFTRVCEKELCTFRDDLARYNQLGAEVLGISVDLPFSQQVFAKQYGIPFPLFSDFNKEAIRAFGVVLPDLKGLRELAQRAVFVADGEGVVRWAWVAEHPGLEPPYAEVERAVRALESAGMQEA